MNPLAFPSRGSSLSPPLALRSQNPTPPTISNSFASPISPQVSSPIRRKPLPPTAFASPISRSPTDAGVSQTVSRKRAETNPARKDDDSPESVVRDLDRCAFHITTRPGSCPHEQRHGS